MSKGLGKEQIKEYYVRLSDQELLYIISQNAHGLTEEAIEVIKEELSIRHLSNDLVDVVVAQNSEYTIEELDQYCSRITHLSCPECKKNTSPLTAAYVCQTVSFIYITFYKKRLDIRCPQCISSDNNYAFGLSLFLGWWGLPYGPIRTIQSISNYFKTRKIIRIGGPSGPMRDFVLANIGLLELHKNDNEKIDIMLNNQIRNQPLTSGIKM